MLLGPNGYKVAVVKMTKCFGWLLFLSLVLMWWITNDS